MPSVPKLGSVDELSPADRVLVRRDFGLGDGGTRSVASVAWFEVLQKKPLPRVAKVLRRPPPFERRVPRTVSCSAAEDLVLYRLFAFPLGVVWRA